MQSSRCLTVVIFTALFLTSCGDSNNVTQQAQLNFTSDDITSFLGLSKNSGLAINGLISNKDGVRVASITFDDGSGDQVEVRDIDLKIAGSNDLVYSITSLAIADLDIHLWKTNQRIRLTGLQVDKPGSGFLSALQASFSPSPPAANALNASKLLSFSRLAIARIDHLTRANDGAVSKIDVRDLIVDGADKDTFDVAVRELSFGATVAATNISLTKLSRKWLNHFFESPDLAVSSIFADKGFPFDSLGATQMNFRVHPIGELEHFTTAGITNAKISVNRDSLGRILGVEANLSASIPIEAFGKDIAPWLQEIVDAKTSAEPIVLEFHINFSHDPESNIENLKELSVTAPKLFNLTLSGAGRGFLASFSKLFAGPPSSATLDSPTISAINAVYADNGLLPHLLSPKYGYDKEVYFYLAFGSAIFNSDTLKKHDPKESADLDAELRSFVVSPGKIIIDFLAPTPVKVSELFQATSKSEHPASTKLRFVCGPTSSSPLAQQTGYYQSLSFKWDAASKAKDYNALETAIRGMIALYPDAKTWSSLSLEKWAIKHYNLACALVQQKRMGEALDELQMAVDFGYTNTNQMSTDSDLEALRGEQRYQDIYSRTKALEATKKN